MRYVIAGIVVLLLLAACQGGGVTTTDVGTDGANVKVDAGTGGANVKVDAGSVKVEEKSGLAKTLGDIISSKKTLSYKVEYETTANGVSTTMTQVVKLPKVAVLSMAQGVESKVIFDGTSAIVCTMQEGAWQCMKVASQENMGTVNTEASLETADASMKPTGTCRRAGETGVAFDVSVQGATVHICYTLDGIPLEMSTTAQGVSTSMVAKSVSRSVSDSEFVPPAEPQDLSALMAQYGAQS